MKMLHAGKIGKNFGNGKMGLFAGFAIDGGCGGIDSAMNEMLKMLCLLRM